MEYVKLRVYQAECGGESAQIVALSEVEAAVCAIMECFGDDDDDPDVYEIGAAELIVVVYDAESEAEFDAARMGVPVETMEVAPPHWRVTAPAASWALGGRGVLTCTVQ